MAGAGTSASGSTQYNQQVSTGATRAKIETQELHGKLRIAKVNVTVDANSGSGSGGALVTTDEINLIILPPNPRILLMHSFIKFSATQGVSTEVDIGWRAFTANDGTAIAEDADGILNGWDAATTALEDWVTSVGAVGTNATYPVDVLNTIKLSSKGPITLFMTCLDAGGTYAGDLGDTYDFLIAYVTD